MYVVCFYWQGDRWQETGYKQPTGHVNHLAHHMARAGQIDHSLPSRYVNNLFYGVQRFATMPFTFVCFTNEKLDLDDRIEVRSFKAPTTSGVLPRVYMFSEAAGLFGHQVLCLDIDIVITGSLDRLMQYDGLFCSRSNFGEDRIPDGDIMSFKAGKEAEDVFWTPFVKNPKAAEDFAKGRERFWLWKCVKDRQWDLWDDWAPGSVVSYKKAKIYRTHIVPRNASIVSCHGVPRPHQITDKWIKKYWV
jgi:hypothetical protein